MKVRNISKKPIFIGAKTFIMENEEMKVDPKYQKSGAIDTLIDHGYLVEVPDVEKPAKKEKPAKAPANNAEAHKDAAGATAGKQE